MLQYLFGARKYARQVVLMIVKHKPPFPPKLMNFLGANNLKTGLLEVTHTAVSGFWTNGFGSDRRERDYYRPLECKSRV